LPHCEEREGNARHVYIPTIRWPRGKRKKGGSEETEIRVFREKGGGGERLICAALACFTRQQKKRKKRERFAFASQLTGETKKGEEPT